MEHSDIHFFEDMRELVINLQTSNSTNDKIDCLKDCRTNPELMSLLHYMYNPYFQYHVSWKNIKKRADLNIEFTADIFTLLDMLKSRSATGHEALGIINGYLTLLPDEFHPMVELIFERSLKARVDAKLINRVMPDLIPSFNVALASKFEDVAHRIDWNDEWFWSRKLDGVRVIVRIQDRDIKFFSRSGKEFYTLGNLKTALKENMVYDNVVLDGELCIVDENGNEDFQSIIKEVRRKDHTIEKPVLKIFDMLTVEAFDSGETPITFKDRLADICEWNVPSAGIVALPMHRVTDEDHVYALLESATKDGWEGIMLRKDAPYKGKRTNDLLKVKKMHDEEYVVQDIEYGPFRIIDPGTGLEATIETMTNVIIEHKGNPVSVGSGFTIGQRQKYYMFPELIIGKEITVQYFEESQDKTGKHSLRFPVCKTVYEEGTRMV